MTPMNRIDSRFARIKAAGRRALVPFITAGDPSLEATVPVMHALVAAGADVLELGLPFSDPMADGPVIQRSSERALARGANLAHVFDSVRAFRARDADTPVVLMGYLNPVEIRGPAAFAALAASLMPKPTTTGSGLPARICCRRSPAAPASRRSAPVTPAKLT